MRLSSRVFWITGLSGAGKTTVASEVVAQLREHGAAAVLIDGDAVREVVGDPVTGHDRESRLVNAYRIARLAKMLADQGLVVVVATISLFREIHAWNRSNLPGYLEVYLKVDLEVARKRDPKGLYERAGRGEEANLAGLDLDFDAPCSPHLVIDNNAHAENVVSITATIISAIKERPDDGTRALALGLG